MTTEQRGRYATLMHSADDALASDGDLPEHFGLDCAWYIMSLSRPLMATLILRDTLSEAQKRLRPWTFLASNEASFVNSIKFFVDGQ